ncbi:hypothetical protein PMPD1_0892 [Paramixta manurensis]|uniref:Uncharacterized protein n=1 Tax=Paramixta manurensis TaxID=2740817 RepID=A0A6M8UK83_9GAMM|nr:hypothetical protein PMPD1_0892 [Erwiniaceae bacterium PD-1]
MLMRFPLTILATALMLTGCVSHKVSDGADEKFDGPTQLSVSHLVTRADDGSQIHLTVDGKDAGLLPGGESRNIHLSAGKHQVGGYVSTLFSYGRVTVDPTEVTTTPQAVQNIVYSVTNNKPVFAVTDSTPVPPPAPVQPAEAPAAPAQPAEAPAAPAQPAGSPATPAQPAEVPAAPAQPAEVPAAPAQPAEAPAAPAQPAEAPAAPAQPAEAPAAPAQPAEAPAAPAQPAPATPDSQPTKSTTDGSASTQPSTSENSASPDQAAPAAAPSAGSEANSGSGNAGSSTTPAE